MTNKKQQKTVTPWAAAIDHILSQKNITSICHLDWKGYGIYFHEHVSTLWLIINCPGGGRVVHRTAYCPSNTLEIAGVKKHNDGLDVAIKSVIGTSQVKLRFPSENETMFQCTTSLKPNLPLSMPFWPRDLYFSVNPEDNQRLQGRVHVSQMGSRSGLQFVSMDKPKGVSLLYFQNLTALNPYFQDTETSASGVVGGTWPELGLSLPPAVEKPLKKGKEYLISDAYFVFSESLPENETEVATLFMDLLALAYLHVPKPATEYIDWPLTLEKGLQDLESGDGCWTHASGQDYLNAYLCDYDTPPELMVQLAVLLPMLDYQRWSGKEVASVEKIKKGLAAFYDEKLKTVVRWLPAKAGDLDESEEQLKANVMDSWYLHHPLLNLSRLAQQGDKNAEKLFFDSLPFSMKVARHFNYEWPVFYDMFTLEVIKGETQPGAGGEKDVAGLYSNVMLQAWKLSKEDKYLAEAKKAAKTLVGKGLDVFYQANNTAFSANTLLELHQITKEKVYLDLSYLCLAGIFKNMHLWECEYGLAKHYHTFFALFPLNDAPYTAAYEEQEVFAAMHQYLSLAEKIDLLPSVSLLLTEFIKYVIHRVGYYYPPNLPDEVLSKDIKMGEVDRKLWIAVEDLHDGWEQSGSVGQEVYGAGVAFGIVPRHYHQVVDEKFQIFCEYPLAAFRKRKNECQFKVLGDARLSCRLAVIGNSAALPKLAISSPTTPNSAIFQAKKGKTGNMEYIVCGNQEIRISWK